MKACSQPSNTSTTSVKDSNHRPILTSSSILNSSPILTSSRILTSSLILTSSPHSHIKSNVSVHIFLSKTSGYIVNANLRFSFPLLFLVLSLLLIILRAFPLKMFLFLITLLSSLITLLSTS